MSKVVIFQYRLFHYRLDLFNAMRHLAAARGIDLVVVAGQPYGKELLKKDIGELGWETTVENIYFPIGEKKDLCWQPMPAAHGDADLVVFMQENRLLANYWWILKRKLGVGPLVAYWGHGRDFQTRAPGGLRERWKQAATTWVDWWFAYTSITVDFVKATGFPERKITQLNNAIDVRQLVRDWEEAPPEMVAAARVRYGIKNDGRVGVFCGSLYADKKLELLFEAADLIRKAYGDFVLIIIGDGPMGNFVRQAASTRPWVTYEGVRRGREKAVAFGLSTVMLNPGSVGLHILDAFSVGLPMVTIRTAQHGPEIGYMEPGVNGVMVEESSSSAYAASVIALFADPVALASMREMGKVHALRYTVEAMAENFIAGIQAALQLKQSSKQS